MRPPSTELQLPCGPFSPSASRFACFMARPTAPGPAHEGRVVDINARSTTCSNQMCMDKFVQATLARGLVRPVVMEFPGTTVRGGFAGSAGEKSSFRYGYFDQTVKSIKVVLATGDMAHTSPSENPDLFRGAGGTAGTLDIVTKLEVGLIPARRFVELAYHRYKTVADTLTATLGLDMTGKLTDDLQLSRRPQTFTGSWDDWFYLHAKRRAELCVLVEYLFRYNRGGSWMGAQAFAYSPFVPFNRLTRWVLNDFMHTQMLYRALQGSNVSTAEAFIDYTAEVLDIWPLWLCPLRAIDLPAFHPYYRGPSSDGPPQPMINIGLWEAAELKHRLAELGGRKVLYAHTYYTEDGFWAVYDRACYEGLRERYRAATLTPLSIRTICAIRSKD
ncbi:hypothetical protein N657DRAFT_666497 [Parathielavia appendiculata]|uniref:Delta(24)-sterol reductase n=1 Tax=Parathielavia appendiculata TaxID=2587402 RepID=A0AAN6YZW2_9PEZI|nr:hypothetical protein N657DRAFT_666497 [Parathielavia appendiculata]